MGNLISYSGISVKTKHPKMYHKYIFKMGSYRRYVAKRSIFLHKALIPTILKFTKCVIIIPILPILSVFWTLGLANTYTASQKPCGQKGVDTLKGIYSNKEMKVIASYIMYVMNQMELFHNTIHIRCLFRQYIMFQ